MSAATHPSRWLRLRRPLMYALWALSTVSICYTGFLYLKYGMQMPTLPQPSTGRTEPFMFKSSLVYVTPAEAARFYRAEWVAATSPIAFMIMALLPKRGGPKHAA